MQIFIDESGNLGSQGDCFVICCFVPENTKRTKNIVHNACVDFGSQTPLEELKAYALSLPQKQLLINKILSKSDCSFSYVVAEKCHVLPHVMADKNVCYNYLLAHVLKKVLKGAQEDVEIILDNHTIKVTSLSSLEDYIRIEAYGRWGFTHKLRIRYMDSKDCKSLQVADLLANTIYGKYERGSDHLFAQLDSMKRYIVEFPYSKFSLPKTPPNL